MGQFSWSTAPNSRSIHPGKYRITETSRTDDDDPPTSPENRIRAEYDWSAVTPRAAGIETLAIALNRELTLMGPSYDSVVPDVKHACPFGEDRLARFRALGSVHIQRVRRDGRLRWNGQQPPLRATPTSERLRVGATESVCTNVTGGGRTRQLDGGSGIGPWHFLGEGIQNRFELCVREILDRAAFEIVIDGAEIV